jgi:hypothetical protein
MEIIGVRYLTGEVLRFLSEESGMAFISGPRQVGKTTLARHLLAAAGAESQYFNWDVESHRKAIIHYPEDFWRGLSERRAGGKTRIVLDEIHKFPRWKRFLKGLYDAQSKDLEVIVTGSGRLDIYQRGGDSLFGRYQLYHLHPFTVGEMLSEERTTVRPPQQFWQELESTQGSKQAEICLQEIETLTGFPEPLFSSSEARLRRWRLAHERLVLREDLRDLTRIREIGLVETLVSLLPERVGSPLSVNALREDLGVNFLTVQGWLEALERLYYLFKIRPYSGRLARTLRREEKVYLYDFTGISQPGPRFENLVAVHLHKLCQAWTDWGFGVYSLHYVRDREKREVDFLIAENQQPYALVEAKVAAAEPDPHIRYFAERLKAKHAVQVVREPQRFKHTFISNRITMTPASEFLSLI